MLIVAACNGHAPLVKEQPSTPVADNNSAQVPVQELNTGKEKLAQVTPDQDLTDRFEVKSSPAKMTYADVWIRIGANLNLDHHTTHRDVNARLKWYARNQDYLDRVSVRALPYIYFIVEELEKRNMPVELALLPIVESAYHPFAYSSSKASGIWQFIPGTGRHYGLKQNWWYDGRRDIVAATRAALDYLDKLHTEFDGDWLLALAAYNTGERNVARAIRKNRKAGKKTDFWSLRLPRETRGYVPSLLAVAELVGNPEKYNIAWQAIPNTPYFEEIDIQGQIDLAMAATMADLSMDELYTLNPAFNRWATDPEGPHKLLIPVSKQAMFKRKLANVPEKDRINWKQHKIKRGESLDLIARRYRTNISTLKQANGLRSNLIREGHSLLIPASKEPMQYYTLSLDSRRYRGLKKSGDGEKYIYTVVRGDTLWDIGSNYGVSVARLCAWNGISSASILKLGQKLNLWLSEQGQSIAGQSSTTGSASAMQTSVQDKNRKPANYTVKKGDSLWLISKRFGTTVSQLRKWNKLPVNKPIHPGQRLILHAQEV